MRHTNTFKRVNPKPAPKQQHNPQFSHKPGYYSWKPRRWKWPKTPKHRNRTAVAFTMW